jgi:hypothetical protein
MSRYEIQGLQSVKVAYTGLIMANFLCPNIYAIIAMAYLLCPASLLCHNYYSLHLIVLKRHGGLKVASG